MVQEIKILVIFIQYNMYKFKNKIVSVSHMSVYVPMCSV